VIGHNDPSAAFPGGDAFGVGTRAATPRGFGGFSGTWCGTPRTTDDQINETGSLSAAKFHVVYAYPSDGTNLFSTYDDVIQDDINGISTKLDEQAGSAKTIRFDMGTDGGTGCVDITTVALPDTAASYATPAGTAFAEVAEDVAPLFGLSRPPGTIPAYPRNLIVYADFAVAGTAGSADGYADDSASGNYHEYGGLVAVIFNNGSKFADTDPPDIVARRDAALHEMGHNLGAVQGIGSQMVFPPHASKAAHCYDEYDVMCYADGGPGIPMSGLTFTCSTAALELFDCDQDDYFDPTETMGTYLDTHWNTYNSAFLCPVSPSTACVPDTIAPSQLLTVTKTGTGGGVVMGPGISCPADCTELYTFDDGVALTAMAATGSTFTGWSGECSGTGACMFEMDGAKGVTATFTASPAPSGGGSSPGTTPKGKKCKKKKKRRAAVTAKKCKKKKS
jgi:hypothetical protein